MEGVGTKTFGKSRLFPVMMIIMGWLTTNFTFGQAKGLHVNGNLLLNRCDETIVPIGVNYSVLDDWNFPANLYGKGTEKLSEIAKTNANAVRIQWYADYGQSARPSFNETHLDSLLGRCQRNGIVPIVGLWDLTCGKDWSKFDSLVAWWVRPSMLSLMKKHEKYLVVNPFNEFGEYEWTGDTAKALNNFISHYAAAISLFRKKGITVPIMIDAPDCGQNPEALLRAGGRLLQADSLKNILLSVHSYWYFYPWAKDSASIANKVQEIVRSRLPFVFGEVANYQTVDPKNPCQYVLPLQNVLTTLKKQNIGWLAWTWENDYCASRQLADSGKFQKLTPYGNLIVNNPQFGIKNNAVKKNCTVALPIGATDFSILEKNGSVIVFGIGQLNESEKIELEQSFDGEIWQNITGHYRTGKNGNLLMTISRPSTESFYRLAIIDRNGNLFRSKTIRLDGINNAPVGLVVYPNPATTFLNIAGLEALDRSVFMQTMDGRMIKEFEINPIGTLVRLELGSIRKGVYLLSIGNRKYRSTKNTIVIVN